jgi:hypothetical protein
MSKREPKSVEWVDKILDSVFYADDGMLTGEDPAEVEHHKGLYTVGFARIGMNMYSNVMTVVREN